MKTHIRTAVLVTVVALLIWLWAEGESLSPLVVTPRVVFVQDGSDLVLKTDEEWRGQTVRLRLEGSTRAINDAERALGSQITLKLGQYGLPGEPGERQVLNLADAIRQLPAIRQAGLTVQEVDPPTTVVNIVRIVRREFPVRAVFPTDIDLQDIAVVVPAKVTVRMPEQLVARLGEGAAASVVVGRGDLDGVRDDSQQTVTLPVRLPVPLTSEDGVSVTPDKVNVIFRVRKGVETVAVKSVPVWVALPPTESAAWDIELTDQFLSDVTFTGPSDAIAKIRSREIIPIGEVRISSDELEKGIESKEAVIVGTPQGVEFSVASKTIRLKITKRKTEKPDSENLKSPDHEAGSGKENF